MEFETKDIEEVLDDYYTGTTVTGDQKIAYPIALQILAAYYIGSRCYLGPHTGLSMRESPKSQTSNSIKTVSVAPAF